MCPAAPARSPIVATTVKMAPEAEERVTTNGAATTSSVAESSHGPGYVWYFAYGSNMNPATLTGRRKVVPMESRPGVLGDWVLSFRMIGLPYIEPGFATIERVAPSGQSPSGAAASALPTAGGSSSSGSSSSGAAAAAEDRWRREVHGVLHRVSVPDWIQIMATEGVGSGNSGYRVVEVEVRGYDGRCVRALTLEGGGAALHAPGRRPAPSRRYLELLRGGARHYGLDPAYVAHLDEMLPYQRSDLAANVGRAVAMATIAPLALPLLPPLFVMRSLRERQRARTVGASGSAGGGSGGGSTATASVSVTAAATAAVGAAKAVSDLPSKASAAVEGLAPPLPAAAKAVSEPAMDRAAAAATAASRRDDGRGPPPPELLRPPSAMPAAVSYYIRTAQALTWAVHDYLVAPVLGSGCESTKQEQR